MQSESQNQCRTYTYDELDAAEALVLLSCSPRDLYSPTDMLIDEPDYKSEGDASAKRSRRATAPLPEKSKCSTGRGLKPRWQEPERLSLFLAIVKDKKLDDMSTFNWERIAAMLGSKRGGKACKDQWRREVLPALMNATKP